MMESECLMGPCPLEQLSARRRCLSLLVLLGKRTVLCGMREAQAWEFESLPRGMVGGVCFVFSVGHTSAYTTFTPIHSWTMPSSTLALEPIGPCVL